MLSWQAFHFALQGRTEVPITAEKLRGQMGAELRSQCDGDRCFGFGCPYHEVFERPGQPSAYRVTAQPNGADRASASLTLWGPALSDHRVPVLGAFAAAVQRRAGSIEAAREDKRSRAEPWPEAETVVQAFDRRKRSHVEIRLELVSPLRIMRHRKALESLEELTFAAFFDALIRRLQALEESFGDPSGIPSSEALRTLAREVPGGKGSLRLQSATRYSSRQRNEIPASGLLGTVSWEDVPDVFLPFIARGQVFGLGSGSAWGQGAYLLK